MTKQTAFEWINSHKESMEDIAKLIWKNPENCLEEKFACELQKKTLKDAGFKITEYEDIPTGFYAEYGEGKPVIGLLGEYDALKNLSQDATPFQNVLKEEDPGHGCGHNLLGVGCLAAALSIKECIAKGQIKGKVRYYGCPAEEILYGKVKMAQKKAFDDLDACLSWHPSSISMPWAGSLLSLYSLTFTFKGKASHAGSAPHLGRSALDAVELMNVGANYMREHVDEQNRIHYIITNGGKEPNTVPADATVWYNVRAPKKAIALETVKWLVEIAEGAAKMTQTTLQDVKVISGCYEILTNQTLVKAIGDNMRALGGPEFTEADRDFAKKINESFNEEQKRKGFESNFIPLTMMDKYLHEGNEPSHDFGRSLKASTDVGDVSWITPLAMFGAATWPLGVVAHTWQAVASSGAGVGINGMHYASKVLAATMIDMFTNPDLLVAAKREFDEATKGKKYINAFDEKIL